MSIKRSSAGYQFLEYVLPSKIFKEQKFRGHNKELNRKMASLTDPHTLNYFPSIKQIAEALRDEELVLFQDKQLREQIKNISASTVDIDHLQIGIQLTDVDLSKMTDPENGIERVRTAAREARLSISFVPVARKNQGITKSSNYRTFTHKYRLFVDSDYQRFVDFYLSCPKGKGKRPKKGCNFVIELIPSRLELHHISLIFAHLNSVLGTRRYQQVLDSAEVIRLDTGYNMRGVSQLFTFTGTFNNRFKKSALFPENEPTETTYIGSHRNSHFIVYDKVLKENKSFITMACEGLRYPYDMVSKSINGIDSLFLDQLVSVRTEYRCLFDNDELLLFSELEKHISKLEELYFIRPNAVAELPQKSIKGLVCKKGISTIRETRKSLEEHFNGKESRYLLSFDKDKLRRAVSERLADLKAVIMNPVGDTEFNPSVNVRDHILAARAAIKPLINRIKTKHDSEQAITSSDASVIYVEGCPGSGKTRLIAERVAHLIASGVPPQHITVLAYTNDARDEFAMRLDDLNLPVADMFVGTFSAWCNQVILGKKYNVLDPQECTDAIKKLIPKNFCDTENLDIEDMARNIQRITEHMANFDSPSVVKATSAVSPHLADYADKIADVIGKFESFKDERKLASFSDLLTKSRQKLISGKVKSQKIEKLVSRSPYLLVDEVQDSNNVQWDILKRYIMAGGELFCVGDPAQSMYGFRGATSKSLTNLMQIEKAKKFVQTVNSRSVKSIVELSNHVRRAINRKYLVASAKRLDGAIPRYIESDDLKSAIHWLVRDIKLRASEGQSDFLILCRFNKHLDEVERALKKLKARFGTNENFKLRALTYHKAKGQEAKTCYVFDSTFSAHRHSSLVEERCNLYVAMTRAEDHLTLIASKGGTGWYSVLKNGERTFSLVPSVMVSVFNKLLEVEDNELLHFERT